MDLIIYILFLLMGIMVSMILPQKSPSAVDIVKESNDSFGSLLNKKTPFLKLSLIATILSFYSAFLANSDKFVDTARYAWSFLYRYPQYFESVEIFFNSRTELGFLIINYLISKFTENPFWLFLAVAIFVNFTNIFTLSKFRGNFTLKLILYMVSIYFFSTMYLLRQAIAVSISNLAFLSFIKNKNIKAYITILIAASFHTSAIVALPIFIFMDNNKNEKIYKYYFALFLIVFFFSRSILEAIYSVFPYLNQFMTLDDISVDFGNGSLLTPLKGVPYYIVSIFALIKRKSIMKIMPKADIFIISSFIYSFSWLLTFNQYWAFRMGWYFFLPTIILIPSIISSAEKKKEKYIIAFFIFVPMVLFTFRQIYITIS